MAPEPPPSGWRRWRAGIMTALLLHGGLLLALVVRVDGPRPPSAPPSFAVEMVAAPPSPSPQPDRPQEQPQLAPPRPVTPMPPIDLPHTAPNGIALPPSGHESNTTTTTAPQAPASPAPPPAAAVAIAPAPRVATTGSDTHAKMTWESDVLARLEAAKRYPPSARFAHEEATIQVLFEVDRNGRVLHTQLVRPSNIADLDAEVLSLLRRVRLPPPPSSLPDDSLRLTVPIEFSIDRG